MPDYTTFETSLSLEERDGISTTLAKWDSEHHLARLVLVGLSPTPAMQAASAPFPAFPKGEACRTRLDKVFGNPDIAEYAIRVNANGQIYRAKNGRSGFEYKPAEMRLLELLRIISPETRQYHTLLVACGDNVFDKLTYAVWKHLETHLHRPKSKEILGKSVSPDWLPFEHVNLSVLGMPHPAGVGFKKKIVESGWKTAFERLDATAA